MEKPLVKIIALLNNLILISEIKEVGADIGEPDCKLVSPFVIRSDYTMEPFLCGYTKEKNFMISSDKIITLADPTPTLLEKYEDLIKE
jgi:hypothetical protein